MTPGLRNWQAALLAWLLATLLVGGGFLVFQALRRQPPNWRSVGVGAGLAGLYALYLARRFRDDRDAEPPARE